MQSRKLFRVFTEPFSDRDLTHFRKLVLVKNQVLVLTWILFFVNFLLTVLQSMDIAQVTVLNPVEIPSPRGFFKIMLFKPILLQVRKLEPKKVRILPKVLKLAGGHQQSKLYNCLSCFFFFFNYTLSTKRDPSEGTVYVSTQCHHPTWGILSVGRKKWIQDWKKSWVLIMVLELIIC